MHELGLREDIVESILKGGGYAAYKFTTGGVNDDIALWTVSDTLDYDPSNPFRSKRSRYVLPSYNEWYKAAYYNPSDSLYYDYANGSDTAPIAVLSGTTANTAVFTGNGVTPTGPADVDQAGGLSPYGVMGLGGNVVEWEENSFDLANSINSYAREGRGGNWSNLAFIWRWPSPRAKHHGDLRPGCYRHGLSRTTQE